MSDRRLSQAVTNATDRRQIDHARRLQKRQEQDTRNNLLAVLQTAPGRAFVWWLLGKAGPDQSVYDPSGSMMYFKEGRRNFGLELKAAILDASEEAYELMEREGRAAARRIDHEIDAAHLARPSTGDEASA